MGAEKWNEQAAFGWLLSFDSTLNRRFLRNNIQELLQNHQIQQMLLLEKGQQKSIILYTGSIVLNLSQWGEKNVLITL